MIIAGSWNLDILLLQPGMSLFPHTCASVPVLGRSIQSSGIDEQFRQSVYSHIVFKKQVIENERPKSELKLNDGHFERLGEIKEETLESSPWHSGNGAKRLMCEEALYERTGTAGHQFYPSSSYGKIRKWEGAAGKSRALEFESQHWLSPALGPP